MPRVPPLSPHVGRKKSREITENPVARYGRALQGPALEAWRGRDEPVSAPWLTASGATGRRASGRTPTRWRRARWARALPRIAASGRTTDTRGRPLRRDGATG